jgi:hypothetical protein
LFGKLSQRRSDALASRFRALALLFGEDCENVPDLLAREYLFLDQFSEKSEENNEASVAAIGSGAFDHKTSPHSGESRDPGLQGLACRPWTPAFAGVTEEKWGRAPNKCDSGGFALSRDGSPASAGNLQGHPFPSEVKDELIAREG